MWYERISSSANLFIGNRYFSKALYFDLNNWFYFSHFDSIQ